MEVRGGVVAAGVVGLLLVGVGSVKGCSFYRELRLRRAAPELCAVPTTRAVGGGYIRGRIAAVNQDHQWDVLIGTYAPEAYAAHSIADVQTCVVIDWSYRAAGIYETVTTRNGDPSTATHGQALAKQQTAHVTVVDLSIPAVVAEADFQGRVAEAIRSDGTGDDPAMGQKPIEEIERWLYKELPHK